MERGGSGRPEHAQGAKRATIRTISEITGLSLSTVSLALRGGERLKAETHRRVMEVAEQLGYEPNRAGVRLRTGKTNVIALVLERTDETIDFARFLIQGIGRAIRGTPYHLTVSADFGGDDSLRTIRRIIADRSADGLIITHTTERDPRVDLLIEAGFPFVTHGRTERRIVHPYVDFHSEEFVRLAVDRMVQKGRRRLMMLAGPNSTYNFQTIARVYRTALDNAQIEGTLLSPEVDRTAWARLREYGQEIAASPRPPDGIICDNELSSIFVIAGLIDGGLTPQDIHFICKQTSNIIPALYPQIDTLEEDVLDAGRLLAEILVRAISGEGAHSLGVLTEPRPHWRT